MCLIVCDPTDCSPRFLCPWGSPDKDTGMGCHFLLHGIFWPRDQTCLMLPGLAGRFFTTSATWGALKYFIDSGEKKFRSKKNPKAKMGWCTFAEAVRWLSPLLSVIFRIKSVCWQVGILNTKIKMGSLSNFYPWFGKPYGQLSGRICIVSVKNHFSTVIDTLH